MYPIKLYQKYLMFKQFKILFLLSILLCSLIAKESLSYSVSFKGINAGEAILTSNIEELSNQSVYHIHSEINSNKIVDLFYKLRDQIDIWVDKNDYSLIKINKIIHEGKYKAKLSGRINGNFFESSNKKIQLDEPVFDPISLIYKLREEILDVGKSFSFTTFDMGKIRKIITKVVKIETIKVPAGEYNCFKMVPFSSDGKPLFKQKGQMTIWYSTDSLHIPIMIKQRTNIGTIKMKLKSISNR